MSSRTFAAADGDALVFPSYVAFGDAQATQLDVDYLAERTGEPGTPGWRTHAITPRQEPLSLYSISPGGVNTGFEPTFTPDLSSGVYRAWRPLTEAPNVADVANVYRLDGLRGAAAATTLLSDAFAPVTAPRAFFLFLQRPIVVGASRDLSHVVFESRAQLTPEAPADLGQKLYEWVDGVVRLVGILPDGTPAAQARATFGFSAQIYYPMPHTVSADGSHVFFTDPTTGNIYVRIDGTDTVQLNASEKSTPEESPAPASLWEASADGTRAFFITAEALVDGDDDTLPDLYMYDEAAPAGERLSVLSVHDPELFVDAVIGASDDGHYVYFIAEGIQIYLWHDGAVTFVGALSDGSDAGFNRPDGFYNALPTLNRSRVTPDGRHLIVTTRGDGGFKGLGGFGGYDHAGHEEIYVYSADTGAVACASCNPSGAAASDDALPFAQKGFGLQTWHQNHALSSDGRWVFFNTRDALVAGDANGRIDAYEYDVDKESVRLLSSGAAPTDSFFLEASPSGADAFIATRERLAGWDLDENYDVYDVRVNGGLPEPPPVPGPCSGEACQGAPHTSPGELSASSASLRGAGNHRVHRPRCTKKQRRVRRNGKVRCAKKHRKHHKRADNHRRAGR